ncbi:cation:proton antiporter [Horticoccus luteus]|uniref:Cation:proton antiporter n=1 Tax=Horticoccus luteus TaxID=2862869 RepID=A0A8F9TUP2_9BACT|nr:cation:proton antiporter [Horticoccus luteus]QYM79604.1 cation:proton antiporter [Horticoccus luteus]
MSVFDLSVHFFLQLAVVLMVCRVVCWASVRLGQPPVVGEMIAGVILGPSIFGYFFPGAQASFFPADSRAIIFAGAQLGLALYMFTVGLDFRTDLLRTRLQSVTLISASGILAPFALGCGIAWLLLGHGTYFAPSVTALQAIPFLGAAMAITAFPMLARIIFERGLSGTAVGALALAAGAIDDAAAWGVLALVLASFANDPQIAIRAIGGGLAFVALLFTVGRIPLGWINRLADRGESGARTALCWTLVALLLCAWFTDTIRLYAVFGAFFLGVAMPRGAFAQSLQKTIEPLTTSLLLPLFFIYSGLNTRFDLVNDPALWLVTLGVLAAAVVGKAGACYLAARACGETHRNALGLGALMNSRGLMELIILNIGLERGIITPTLFSILVFMAIVTTLMSTPMFNRACGADYAPRA